MATDDQQTHQPTTTTTTIAEPPVPKWGDPLNTIPPARQAVLRALHDQQVEWAKQSNAEPSESPLALATRGEDSSLDDMDLTGAEVFFLAAHVLAGSDGNLEAAATRLRAVERYNRDTWVALSNLHLEGATLGGAHLEEAYLNGAHLEGTELNGSHLEGAILASADMISASLSHANLYSADLSGAHLEYADLSFANLEYADLIKAHLKHAYLRDAHMKGAKLREADLEHAYLQFADLERAALYEAHLERADLFAAHLEHADLIGAYLNPAYLRDAYLNGALLQETHLEYAYLCGAHLEDAFGEKAYMQGADLSSAHLEHAYLWEAHLEGANISNAHLEGADLHAAHLEGADLQGAFLNPKTILNGATIDNHTRLGDIQWGGVGTVNLTQIAWEGISRLGDEQDLGRRSKAADHSAAIRAYRQAAAQLRPQGVTDAADRFAERAQIRQRKLYARQIFTGWRRPWRIPGNILRWLFSWLLAVIAGYDYRPIRSLFCYLGVIAAFALAYFRVTHGLPLFGLAPSQIGKTFDATQAFVLSFSAFHGRGFFNPPGDLGDSVAILATAEAVCGLFIEISFIATFTQRFFNSR